MNKLIFEAPAKINLGLNIVSKRSDGFHNLETFFYPIKDLFDTLVIEKSNIVSFVSNNPNLTNSSENLIIRAHKLIENYAKRKLPIKIELIKRIPIGAGLGGGSSDAAATLLALNEFFNLDLGAEKLNQFALSLGSDVPFFIESKPAVGYSRGEILHKSTIQIPFPVLIVNPGIHISTKEAFGHIIPKPNKFDYNYFIESNDIYFPQMVNKLSNDFEDFVFKQYSEIKEIKEIMLKEGAVFCQMSGTGSTVFGFFENKSTAKSVSEMFPKHYFKFIQDSD